MLRYYEEEIDFSEDDWFDSLELLVGQHYPDASYEELEGYLDEILEGMSDQEAESFLKSFGNVASSMGKGLLKAAPKIAKTAGTLIGGPVVGNLVGGAIGGLTGAKRSTGNLSLATQVNRLAPNFSTTPATNQLMILINNPKFLVPLLKAITGQRNGLKEEILLNNLKDEISISDMLEALSVLCKKSSLELADKELPGSESFLQDESDTYMVNGSNNEGRAELVLNKFYLHEELVRNSQEI